MARSPSIVLTRLEAAVMRAVWDAEPEPVRVRDVVEALNARRRTRKLAYNTVQTVLTILRDKKAVRVVEGSGRAHLFRARISREEASRSMVNDLADRLFDGRVEPLLQTLVEDEGLTDEELHALRQWVDRRLNDSGEGE